MQTATPAMARAINDRLALDLLLEQGPLTAPQLRALTGLSRPRCPTSSNGSATAA
ncbi:hypothetical protein [Actinomadura sp. J1-007]|uniref:hypothetical protein n=1 Tax=Actinomadura sp. J1-007 TaxID=2661913 RepID=UPI001F502A58|nr:hypothetical protein [Actinomadura sp. J1-007]